MEIIAPALLGGCYDYDNTINLLLHYRGMKSAVSGVKSAISGAKRGCI